MYVKGFFKDKYVIFYDWVLEKHILVISEDSIPFCKNCNVDDCGHVGFAICLIQLTDKHNLFYM